VRKIVKPINKPVVSDKTIKVGKKALLIASVLAVALLCSG
tara:strand:+ start:392 stop:511 length:120 start_codon:yes stop_codon:yes gene_type:complete